MALADLHSALSAAKCDELAALAAHLNATHDATADAKVISRCLDGCEAAATKALSLHATLDT
jgi:hypothetical protein